ncbi:MAG: hypothetical protein AAB530_00290, partial [Patescibacteria group bacterium]
MLYKINNKNKKLIIAGLAVFFVVILFAWAPLSVKASSIDSAVASSSNQAANNSFWSFSGLYQKIVNFIFPNNLNKKYTQKYTELDIEKKNVEIESVNLDIKKKKAEVELAITEAEKKKAEAELATLEIKKKNVEIEQAIVKTEAEASNIKKQTIKVSPVKGFAQETKIIREMPTDSNKQETKIIRETIIASNKVSGNFTISGNSKVDGDLNVGGLVKLGSADLIGDLYNSQGDLIVNDNLVVKSAFTTKALQVLDFADFGGGVNAKDIDSENISVGKKLTVSGNSTIQGSLRVGGTFSAGHAIFSSIGVSGSFGAKSISSSENLVVGGKTQLNGESVDIKGSVNAIAGLAVSGGNFTVGGSNFVVDTAGNITVGGNFTASSSQAYFGTGSFITSSTLPILSVNQIGIGSIVDFKTASTSVFYIDNIGRVGIGTTTPTQVLSVVGNANFAGLIFATNFSGTSTGANTGDITLANNTNGLTIAGQVLTMSSAGASTTGTISSVDWNTFNSKESALTFTGPLAKN